MRFAILVISATAVLGSLAVRDAAAKPTRIALAKIKGDASGVGKAVSDALMDSDLVVVPSRQVTVAIDRLGFDDKLRDDDMAKLVDELEVDALVCGAFDRPHHLMQLTIFANGKRGKPFSVEVDNPQSDKFHRLVRMAVMDKLTMTSSKRNARQFLGRSDGVMEDDDARAKRRVAVKADDDIEEARPAKPTKRKADSKSAGDTGDDDKPVKHKADDGDADGAKAKRKAAEAADEKPAKHKADEAADDKSTKRKAVAKADDSDADSAKAKHKADEATDDKSTKHKAAAQADDSDADSAKAKHKADEAADDKSTKRKAVAKADDSEKAVAKADDSDADSAKAKHKADDAADDKPAKHKADAGDEKPIKRIAIREESPADHGDRDTDGNGKDDAAASAEVPIVMPIVHSANVDAARADLGSSFTGRSLKFTATSKANTPTPYQNVPVPGARFSGEIYPWAVVDPHSWLAGFGVAGDFDQTISLTLHTSAEPTVPLKVSQRHYSAGLRYRIPIGQSPTAPTVTLGGGYEVRSFTLDRKGLMSPSSIDLPDVDYRVFDPGIAFRVPIGRRLAFTAEGRALLATSAGPLQLQSQYGTTQITAGTAAAGLEIVLGDRVGLRIAGEATQFNLKFAGNGVLSNSRDGDPSTVDVRKAVDRYLGGSATLAIMY